jgi:hypothetical protein
MPGGFRLRPTTALSEKTQERTWVEQTMFQDNDAVRAQQCARVAMWSFHATLLLALGLLLSRAGGVAWPAGTLAFVALEPTIGAHLPVVMTDLPLGLTSASAAVCAGLLASGWQWRVRTTGWARSRSAARGSTITGASKASTTPTSLESKKAGSSTRAATRCRGRTGTGIRTRYSRT